MTEKFSTPIMNGTYLIVVTNYQYSHVDFKAIFSWKHHVEEITYLLAKPCVETLMLVLKHFHLVLRSPENIQTHNWDFPSCIFAFKNLCITHGSQNRRGIKSSGAFLKGTVSTHPFVTLHCFRARLPVLPLVFPLCREVGWPL